MKILPINIYRSSSEFEQVVYQVDDEAQNKTQRPVSAELWQPLYRVARQLLRHDWIDQ